VPHYLITSTALARDRDSHILSGAYLFCQCFSTQPIGNSSFNASAPGPIRPIFVPPPIPGTNLLAEWFPLQPPSTIPQLYVDEATRFLFHHLRTVLKEYGNVRIGRAGIHIYTGRAYITAHESATIGMTYNDTMNAFLALEVRERAGAYERCEGDIYTLESWRIGERIGRISLQ